MPLFSVTRNQGIGLCSTSARIGSIIAPYVVMLVGYVLYCIECAREIYVCSRFNAYILLIMRCVILTQAQLPELSSTLPMVIFGSLTVAAGFMSLLLPETLFCPTFQTVEEVNKDKEFYGIACMGKPRPCPLPCLR